LFHLNPYLSRMRVAPSRMNLIIPKLLFLDYQRSVLYFS